MKTKLKIILLAAFATTLAWALVIVGFFWLAATKIPLASDRVKFEFMREPGTLGMVDMRNIKTQAILVAIEQLPTGSDTGRVELARQSLSAGATVRIAVREIAEEKR